MIFVGDRFFLQFIMAVGTYQMRRGKQSQIYLNPRRAISESNTTKIEGIGFSVIRGDEVEKLEGRRIGESTTQRNLDTAEITFVTSPSSNF